MQWFYAIYHIYGKGKGTKIKGQRICGTEGIHKRGEQEKNKERKKEELEPSLLFLLIFVFPVQ